MEECSGDIGRNSCSLTSVENGERDALAAVRMMVSLLSILGASAIITNIIRKKHVWSPTMHPIFQLSIADLALGILWIIGAWLWFRGTSNRAGCFSVSLLTVILECVTANLTMVYALIAFFTLRKMKQDVTLDISSSTLQVLSPYKSIISYTMAWLVPVLVVLLLFASLSISTRLVSDASKCSCWCFPHLGNVLPYSGGKDRASALYLKEIHKLQLGYSVILLAQFLFVFTIMALIYSKVLQDVKIITNHIASQENYLTTDAIVKGHALAKKRILLYLTLFLGIAISTVILAVMMIACEAETLQDQDSLEHKLFTIIHLLQSTTVPMQGFLNCIVYGWTNNGDSIMGDSADVVILLGAKTRTVAAGLQAFETSENEDSLLWNSSVEDKQSLDQQCT